MEAIQAKIKHILEQKLGLSKQLLEEATTLQALELDEIDVVMFAICLEEEFEILVDDAQFSKLQTLDDVEKYVQEQIKQHEKEHQSSMNV